ncbi:MAG: DUF2304 family protein, partial [Lactobacillus sp.]|nr:DUF2304 family protein [Lactobacillus sp.]
MVLVSTEIDFIDNFIIIYLIEIFTHYINKDYQKKYVITDLLIAIINGFIGLYIENLNLVIWFLTTFIYQKCSKKKLNYQYLNARLFAIINILIIALLSSCIESIIIKNTFQNIFGSNYSNNLIAYIRIVLYMILSVFLFIIIEKQKNKINYITQKINHLKLDKNILKLLLFLVISFVGILTISEVTKITNIIILPIFIIFIIFVILTFIQVFSFIQAYSYRQETEAKIVQ